MSGGVIYILQKFFYISENFLASYMMANTVQLLPNHMALHLRRPQALHTPLAKTNVLIRIKACV